MLKVGLVQLNAGDDPAANLKLTRPLIEQAAQAGAALVLTPEVTNCVSASRARQAEVLRHEADDPTLAALREDAARLGIWLLIGSLALKSDDPGGRFVNRSFLLAPDGQIVARYDKIHMFDVTVSETETYRESAGYRPGERAVLAETPLAAIGMTICYDVRFPQLYAELAAAGAEILAVPSAFSVPTGRAHWEVLLRARAIENGAFVLAPAQTGRHAAASGRARQTYGHSLAVSPWGEVLLDMGEAPGVGVIEIDPAEVRRSRERIPALGHRREIRL